MPVPRFFIIPPRRNPPEPIAKPAISLHEADQRAKAWVRASYGFIGSQMLGAAIGYLITCWNAHSLSFANVNIKQMGAVMALTGLGVMKAYLATPPNQVGVSVARVRMFGKK